MRPLRPIVLLLLLTPILLAGCRREAPKGEVWFVHATDPHLYYGDATPAIQQRQEPMNQAAFLDLIRSLDKLPGDNPEPAFLVVSGDFGLDLFAGAAAPQATPTPTPTPTPAASPKVEGAVKLVVDVLSKSPVKDVFLVPGNNDVAEEAPSGPQVAAAQLFWDQVRQGLAGTGVRVRDLTSCYFGGEFPGSCWFDVPGTSYRLVGFPSQSFKNGVDPARSKVQLDQLEKLGALVKESAGKRVLIVTHIPEIDDPKRLAENRVKADPDKTKWAPGRPEWSAASTWNVPKEVFDRWKAIVDSRTVAGVLAGHLHDSHREIYRQPYAWSTNPSERARPEKLYLAPPLSMRYQDTSPIQARGFAVFHLRDGDDPERTLYWYDAGKKRFEREGGPRKRPAEAGTEWGPVARWFWKLAGDTLDLTKAAVIAIAFLAAFLTIVQLWEIPPPKRPVVPAATQTAAATQTVVTDFSAFSSNFVKTVLAGLGGMLILSFLDSIWKAEEFNTRAYYVVLFVTFFFLLLLLYGMGQGLIEGLRSRIITRHPVRSWRPTPPRHSGHRPSRSYRFAIWLSYWRARVWHWALSLRSFFLVVFDTFSNVLCGRNQLRSVVFEQEIVSLHWGIVRAADRIREEIERAILAALKRGQIEAVDEDVRVSVSLLSDDESVLFYIAREEGSLGRGFDKRSVAWVSVYTDNALWWEVDYPPETELLDNTSGGYPLLETQKIRLSAYFQTRAGQDYDAFLVLPVPWAKRAASDNVRKAGIQISFRSRKHMHELFRLPEAEGRPQYDRWPSLLSEAEPVEQCPWTEDDQLRHVLRHSLHLLEDLLSPFNEAVFDMHIKPDLRPR